MSSVSTPLAFRRPNFRKPEYSQLRDPVNFETYFPSNTSTPRSQRNGLDQPTMILKLLDPKTIPYHGNGDPFRHLHRELQRRGHIRQPIPDDLGISVELDDDCVVMAPRDGDCSLTAPYNYLVYLMTRRKPQLEMIEFVTKHVRMIVDGMENYDTDIAENMCCINANRDVEKMLCRSKSESKCCQELGHKHTIQVMLPVALWMTIIWLIYHEKCHLIAKTMSMAIPDEETLSSFKRINISHLCLH